MSASEKITFSIVDPKTFGRVVVLMGGRSAERAVSLTSGKAVTAALVSCGVDAFAIDAFGSSGTENLIKQLQAQPIDTVFNILHGGEGENGSVPCLLQMLDLPYTGNDMPASALAMDKAQCKFLWQGMGLPTAQFEILDEGSDWAQVVDRLGLPLFIKPVHEGSSIGMSKVDTRDELPDAYLRAAQYDAVVLAESWLAGAEYTIGILNGQALPVIRLETDREFYDYQAKYVADDTRYLVPCGLPEHEEREVQALALSAFNSLGCKGWGRVDLMRDADGKFQLLEVNTVPGMTDHSLVPMAAKAAGLNFGELVLQILNTAKKRKKNIKSVSGLTNAC